MFWDKFLNSIIINKKLKRFNEERDKLINKRLNEVKKEQKIISNFEKSNINIIIEWAGKRKLTSQEQTYLFNYFRENL